VDRFRTAAARIDGVELRTMFGSPVAFVGGNMAAWLHENTMLVRVAPAERAERLAAGWAPFEPPPGRRFQEYVAPPTEVAADVDATRDWIERSATHVRSLPSKRPPRAKAR